MEGSCLHGFPTPGAFAGVVPAYLYHPVDEQGRRLKLNLSFEGDVDEVVRILRRIGNPTLGGRPKPPGAPTGPPGRGVPEAASVAESKTGALHTAQPPGGWTEKLAADFAAGLDPVSRRVVHQIRAAGNHGIHRRQLCQRTALTPEELRRLLISMSYEVRRLQRNQGTVLSRPVVTNVPLQRYWLDADFAAVATTPMFGEEAQRAHPFRRRKPQSTHFG